MQGLAQRLWTRRSHLHIGDLAWQRRPQGPHRAQPTRLWFAEGTLVAWIWGQSGGPLHILVDPSYPELFDEGLMWLATASPDLALEATALESDRVLITALERQGYIRRADKPFGLQAFHDLSGDLAVDLPPGFRVVTMADGLSVERKVAGHRAAWSRLADYDPEAAPLVSSMSAARYAQLMQTWPYRGDLDIAIEAPDGRLAASACIWLDEVNGVGLFEPVGVDPQFRRLGLSQAVGLACLDSLKAAGAQMALVKPRGDDNYPVPRHAYKQMGFTIVARQYIFVRPSPKPVRPRAPGPSALF